MFESRRTVTAGGYPTESAPHVFIARTAVLGVVVLVVALVAGCATRRFAVDPLPPVMSHEELVRPYQKVGIVECSRERIGAPEFLTPEDQQWAYSELRNSARRLGADAVISVEIRLDQDSFLLFPTSHVRARGTAVKFR